MKIYRIIALLLLTLASSGGMLAQMPRTVSYQGVLADEQGNFLPDGVHSLTIALYPSATGGSPMYTELHASIPVVHGLFNLIIGSSSPIPAALSFDRAYYLGVSVDGGNELVPRTPMTAAPYAIYAQTAGEALSLAPGARGLVTSVNGLQGDVRLKAGGSALISQSGDTITIYATGGAGSTGIQGIQSASGAIEIQNPVGPIADLTIPAGAIKSAMLADGAVTGPKIADQAVTGAKIADSAITTSKLRDGAVTTRTIANGAVTSAKVADSAITSTHLSSGAVVTRTIADGAVTQDKLASNVSFPIGGDAGGDLSGTYPNPTIALGVVTTAKIADGTILGSDISNSAELAVHSLTTNNDVAIGGAFLGGSRVVVRGAGATAGTSAMDVQNSAGTSMLYVRNDGRVGIGTTAPAGALDVSGTVGGSGLTISNGSFRVSKTAVGPQASGLAQVVTIPPGTTLVRVTDDGVNLPITATFPAAATGEILIVSNDDLVNTITTPVGAAVTITPGQTRLFVFNGTAWRLVN